MRIIVTGLSGAGKTSVRMLLKGLLPDYTCVTINVEREISIIKPHQTTAVDIPTTDWKCTIDQLLVTNPNVIIVGTDLDCIVSYDVRIVVVCDYLTRYQRIIRRNAAHPDDQTHIASWLLQQPSIIANPSDVIIDNTGSYQCLSDTVVKFVDQRMLRS